MAIISGGADGLGKGIAYRIASEGRIVILLDKNGSLAVIRTAMNENIAPEQLAYMAVRIPMKRLGTIEEVASIAAWIVSKESSFNTGFIFDISGGGATY